MENKIYLDTNVLLAVADGFDLFGQLREQYPQCEPVIVEGVLDELEKLRGGSGEDARAARLAQRLIKEQHLNIAPQSAGYVDDALLAAAARNGAYIATLDKELKERAMDRGIAVLTVKNRALLRPA